MDKNTMFFILMAMAYGTLMFIVYMLLRSAS